MVAGQQRAEQLESGTLRAGPRQREGHDGQRQRLHQRRDPRDERGTAERRVATPAPPQHEDAHLHQLRDARRRDAAQHGGARRAPCHGLRPGGRAREQRDGTGTAPCVAMRAPHAERGPQAHAGHREGERQRRRRGEQRHLCRRAERGDGAQGAGPGAAAADEGAGDLPAAAQPRVARVGTLRHQQRHERAGPGERERHAHAQRQRGMACPQHPDVGRCGHCNDS
jgi:hypothetical protein